MRIAILGATVFLFLMTNASGQWEWRGHGKYQLSLQFFEPQDMGAVLIGEEAYLNYGDFRINTAYRRGPWDVAAQGQLIILAGNLLKASRDPRLGGLGASLIGLPDLSDSRQVADLSWALTEGDSHLVLGRMDRLSLGFTRGPLALRVGRQALSWGNGLVFQVLDLFNPFPPNALDTEYKPGSDMLSTQWLFPNGDDLQGIVLPRRAGRDEPLSAGQSSAAVKWRHLAGSLQLELLGARHYRESVAGLGLSGNVAGGVWRFDLSQTFTQEGDSVTSFLFNLDRSWIWGKKNFYGYVEYFYNGFGRTSLDQGLEALDPRLLERLGRGELFNLGRHELVAGTRIEWTPLTTIEPTVLIHLTEPSAYLLLHLHHDWRENLLLDGGFQIGFGARGTEYGGIHSEAFDTFLAPGRTLWIRLSQYF